MKIQTMLAVGFFLVGTSVALADTPAMNHYDVVQDQLWHGTETAPSLSTGSAEQAPANDYSMDHYDVMQDELWHGAETAPIPSTSPSAKASVNHYDVMQDDFWHGS